MLLVYKVTMSTEQLTTPKTLQEAITTFSDEDRCIAYLVAQRWPEGVTCPICGSEKVHYLTAQRRWKCSVNHPKRQFSVKVGTIMEDSAIPLTKWLPAMWMVANCKNGISSYELHRALGVTQKTAWFMNHRIRLAMHGQEEDMLSGTVEADETLVGGKARFMHKDRKERTLQKGRGSAGKAIVMGLLERGDKGKKKSKVKTAVINKTDTETLHAKVRENVATGSTLYTDALVSYRGLEPDYTHQFIDHAETYISGAVHTNGMENFWTLLKRSIKGTYVSVEPFHLFRYLDEQSFRFNAREGNDNDRFSAVAASVANKRLTYKTLIGDSLPPKNPELN
jgi:transposase-like protein